MLCTAVSVFVTGLVASLGLIGVREDKIASLDAEIDGMTRTHQNAINDYSTEILRLQQDLLTAHQLNAVLTSENVAMKSQLTAANDQLTETSEILAEVRGLLKNTKEKLTASQANVSRLTDEVQKLNAK